MRFSGFIMLILIILVSFTPRLSAFNTSKISGSRIAKFCAKSSNQLRFRPAFKNIKFFSLRSPESGVVRILKSPDIGVRCGPNQYFESSTKHV